MLSRKTYREVRARAKELGITMSEAAEQAAEWWLMFTQPPPPNNTMSDAELHALLASAEPDAE